MKPEPPRKRQPSVGGVNIPSQAPPRSAPPDEQAFHLLRQIDEKLSDQLRVTGERLDDHEERLDEHEARLLAIRKGQLDADERAQRIEITATRTLATLTDMRGTDLDMERRLSGVESRLAVRAEEAGAEAGDLAGARAGRRMSVPALLMALASVVGWVIELLRRQSQ